MAKPSRVDWTHQSRVALRGLKIDLELVGLALLTQSRDAVKVLDVEGRVLFVSDTDLESMELDGFGQLLGEPWPELWPEDNRQTLYDALGKAMGGEVVEVDAAAPTAKGGVKRWRVKLLPLGAGSESPRHVLVISCEAPA